jgi:hypothetical protein
LEDVVVFPFHLLCLVGCIWGRLVATVDVDEEERARRLVQPLAEYDTCSVARWKDVATMWRGQRMWWQRESGDNHIGGDDMGDRWREVRGRGRKRDVT